jgi:RND family efflux transporter MFP subunit
VAEAGMAEQGRAGLLVLVLALALTGCESPPDSDGATMPSERKSSSPDVAPALSREASAWPAVIAPAHELEIAPSVDGVLERVLVRTGDRVVAGDTLAIVDAMRVEEDLSITQAELRGQRATLAAARVDGEQARANLEQLRTLAAQGHLSAVALDEAEFDARRAEAAEDLAAASVAETNARIARLRRSLEDTAIVAPFSGLVAERYLDDGAITGPTEPVLRLIAGDVTWVRFAVEPVAASKLGPGVRVRVRFEPDRRDAWARVRHIAPQVDSASELLFVEAQLEAGTEQLPIGTAAFVVRGG